MKRILIIIGILIVLIVLGFALFGGSKEEAPVSDSGSEFPTQSGPLEFPNQEGGTREEGDNTETTGTGEQSGVAGTEGAPTSTILIRQKTALRISHGPIAGATVVGSRDALNIFVRY